jgi:hypothetical protein
MAVRYQRELRVGSRELSSAKMIEKRRQLAVAAEKWIESSRVGS